MAKHATLEERDCIAHLNSRAYPHGAITKLAGRGGSVISRELKQNRDGVQKVPQATTIQEEFEDDLQKRSSVLACITHHACRRLLFERSSFLATPRLVGCGCIEPLKRAQVARPRPILVDLC